MNEVWTTLDELPPGFVFITEDGLMAVKSEYKYGNEANSQFRCILLDGGEYAHFAAKNATLVRPLEIKQDQADASVASFKYSTWRAKVALMRGVMDEEDKSLLVAIGKNLTVSELNRLFIEGNLLSEAAFNEMSRRLW